MKGSISSKDTVRFVNPKLPILMRVEASYCNEGLLAGLFHQGLAAGAFYYPYADRYRKELQSDREGRVMPKMGQRSI